MFLHIANDKSIESISAPTLRQLRTARRRLNRFLCDIPEAKEKFVTLTRHPNALFKAFPLMHKHGVMSAYLPQWSQIVGQMQFDLFHAYTVDEHTVRLLKHIHSYTIEENRDRHPSVATFIRALPSQSFCCWPRFSTISAKDAAATIQKSALLKRMSSVSTTVFRARKPIW